MKDTGNNEKSKEITLKDVSEQRKSEEIKELEEVAEELVSVIPEPIRITKQEFESFFLPFLIGEVERNDINTEIFIYNYLEKTEHSYHRELEVIDDNGDLLYILPPLFIGLDIKDKDMSVSFLTKKMLTLIDSGFYNSDKEIIKGLNAILKSLGTDKDKYGKYILEYNRILSDYKDRFIAAYKKRKGIVVEEVKDETDEQEAKELQNKNINSIDEEDDIFDY